MALQASNGSFFLTKSASSPSICPWWSASSSSSSSSSPSSSKKKTMNPNKAVSVASSSSSTTTNHLWWWLGHKEKRMDGGFRRPPPTVHHLAFALGGSSSNSNSNTSSSNSGGGTDGSNKKKGPGGGGGGGGGVPNSNYVVPLDKSLSSSYLSCITRPLAEILRDLNKRIPDNIIIINPSSTTPIIPWYHANRMLSFYAPGWCGEVRDVIFSEEGSVTVVYRVTIRGSDGEAHRESSGTVSSNDVHIDPVAAAEEIAFCRACARFGLGLYLYHEE